MQGNPRLIDALNQNLVNEFTAVQQYITHAAICRNWGYDDLANYIQKRAKEERQHSQQLIDRILFLEGKPVVTKLNTIYVACEILMQFNYDHAAELTAITGYNDAIKLAVDVGDNSTRSYLEEILNDEINHINDIENYQAQINQMTLPTWLVTQVKK